MTRWSLGMLVSTMVLGLVTTATAGGPGVIPTLHDLVAQAVRQPERGLFLAKQLIPQTEIKCDGFSGLSTCDTIVTEPLLEKDARVKELLDAGLTRAAQQLSATQRFIHRSQLLYAKYPILTEEQVTRFNERLEAATRRKTGVCLSERDGKCRDWEETWQELTTVPLKHYEGIPPASVVKQLKEFRKEFDTLRVAYIQQAKTRLEDPLLLGQVNGSSDYFVLAQWGEDVTYEEVLQLSR